MKPDGLGRRGFLNANLAGGMAWSFDPRRWLAPVPGRQMLLIAADSDVLPYSALLGRAFERQTGIEVVVDGGGTLGALIALRRGAIDIAATDRDLQGAESDGTLLPYLLAKDAIAIVVGESTPVAGLRHDQLAAILSGRIADWAGVGGPAGPIEVLDQAPGSPTRKFVENVLLRHAQVTRRGLVPKTLGELARRLNANPRAIGYLATKDLQPGTRTLPIDGVPLNRASVYSGRYPFTRSMYFVTRAVSRGTLAFMGRNEPVLSARLLEQAKSLFGLAITLLSGAIVLLKWFSGRKDAPPDDRKFRGYLVDIAAIEARIRALEGDPAVALEQLEAIAAELSLLKQTATGQFAAGNLKDDSVFERFLASLADTRAYLSAVMARARAFTPP